MAEQVNPRAVAALAVYQIVFQGRQLNRTLDRVLDRWDAENRRQIAEMVNGVVRWFWLLEHHLDALLERPIRRKDRDLLCLLCVGLYQLEFMRTPPYASVSETVNATTELGKPWARKLTNAILRKFMRDRASLDLSKLNAACRYAHPQWLFDLLCQEWPDDWSRILDANNLRPQMTLRVNVQKTSTADYLQRLESCGISAQPSDQSPVALHLEERVNVKELPGFDAGHVSVQSVASQLVALNMGLAPGQRVLDACAAPGGKLAHMLEIEPRLEKLVAIEIDTARTVEIVDNLHRAGMSAQVETADASHLEQWWDGQPFDRILIDAPCSGLGVISKHPDIKHHRSLEDIDQMVSRQSRLLESLLPLLKRNGQLFYTTCSILARENDGQIETVLRNSSSYAVEPVPATLGHATRFGRQRLPDSSGGIGFYYARLTRQ